MERLRRELERVEPRAGEFPLSGTPFAEGTRLKSERDRVRLRGHKSGTLGTALSDLGPRAAAPSECRLRIRVLGPLAASPPGDVVIGTSSDHLYKSWAEGGSGVGRQDVCP